MQRVHYKLLVIQHGGASDKPGVRDEVLRSVHAQTLSVQRDLVLARLQNWGKLLDPGGRETRCGVGQSNCRFKLT